MANVAKLPDDVQLPELRIITDTKVVKEVFQHRLPGFIEGRLRIEDLALNDFRYAPGEKCRVSYKLQVRDMLTGDEGSQDIFGVIEPNGGAEAKYANARRETHIQPKFGPALFELPELNMVLWGFPNDPKLKQLPRLWDDGTLLELLKQYWHVFNLPPSAKLVNVTTKLIKHAPEDRCTLRHTLHLEGASEVVAYSKIFAPATSGALIFKTIRTLRQAPVCQSGEILIPEPLFFDAEMNVIFMRGLEGVNADENPATLDLDRIAQECGVALAGIHQCHLPDLPSRSEEYTMSHVLEAEEMLGCLGADYKPRLEAITAALRGKYPGLAQVAPTPIHSAFRLSQLLLVDGKIALVDFDDFQLGNPISDVASFVAHLLYLSLKGKLTLEQSRSAIRHFGRAYAGRAPWGLPKEVLAWQTAAHLVGKQAKKCLKLAKKNYLYTIVQLLSMAVEILADNMSLI